ncbi:hypothetical protein BDR04DRAFT_1038333 [Suillus decipiens]|nr:hypothetical protein BDR04DRAFT_1038333 [Suillus decipiens]
MLKTARKHNVSFAPIKLSARLKAQMPAWSHLGAPPKTYHRTKNECLHSTHKAESVKDLRKMTMRLTNHSTHRAKANCVCNECVDNRQLGCKNPDKCARTAKRILDNLNPMFNLNTSPRKDGLTLTHRRLEKNTQMRTR